MYAQEKFFLEWKCQTQNKSTLQLDAYIAEAEDMEREAAIFHNSRIPKSLIVDRKDFCSVDDNDDDEEDEAEAAREAVQ